MPRPPMSRAAIREKRGAALLSLRESTLQLSVELTAGVREIDEGDVRATRIRGAVGEFTEALTAQLKEIDEADDAERALERVGAATTLRAPEGKS